MSGAAPAARRTTVAVVVPVHDYEDFLGATLDSVLAQEPAFHEVLVVDDGSTDGSAAVARGYADRGVRLVQQVNGGQLSACLRGLAETTAEYVYFLDADDLAAPGFLDGLAPALTDRPAKVQFPLAAVDGAGALTGSVFPAVRAGYGTADMVADNEVLGFYTCPPTSGNVYRRDVLAAMDTSVLDLRDFIDGPPTLALPHLGEAIVCLPTPLARYRVHGGNHSQWNRPTPERLQGEIDWFERRWDQTCALLGVDEPPFGHEEPAYVLERRLMLRALAGRGWVLPSAVRFLRRSAAGRLPRTQLAGLSLWALLLVVPSSRLRRALVLARRDPSSRPVVVGRLIAAVRRVRRGPTRPDLAQERTRP